MDECKDCKNKRRDRYIYLLDELSEAEAKAALGWAIHKARIYGSCFECDLDDECRKDDSVDCDMEFLRQALEEARK